LFQACEEVLFFVDNGGVLEAALVVPDRVPGDVSVGKLGKFQDVGREQVEVLPDDLDLAIGECRWRVILRVPLVLG